jgi:hypothetical protein
LIEQDMQFFTGTWIKLDAVTCHSESVTGTAAPSTAALHSSSILQVQKNLTDDAGGHQSSSMIGKIEEAF